MARDTSELNGLRGFCNTVVRFLNSLDAGSQVNIAANEALLASVKSLAQMRAAAASLVQIVEGLEERELVVLDQKLADAGLPTVSSLRGKDDKVLKRVLARGRIRNEAEWRLVQNRLSDTASEGWTALEREQAERLAWDYEQESRG